MDQVTLQFSKIKNTTVQANDACVSATNSRDYISIPESGTGWSFNFVKLKYKNQTYLWKHTVLEQVQLVPPWAAMAAGRLTADTAGGT